MNELTIINRSGQLLVDSRDVATMIDVRHSDLLEKITVYMTHLLNGNFRPVDFFIKSSYEDSTGRTLPCYLLTRKGCDMVANKLTGEKGVLFTAAYVTRFEEMEKQLKPQTIEDLIIMQAQSVKELKAKVQQLEETTQIIKDTFVETDENWIQWVGASLNKVAQSETFTAIINKYQAARQESYTKLEQRAGCMLGIRVRRAVDRAKESGATKKQIDSITKLHIIQEDKRLKEIYTTIVKEMLLAYAA